MPARILLLLTACLALCASDSTGWITSLGGKISTDSAGNVIAVNLRGSWINDQEMIELARMPQLERLDLSHTRITDEGMHYLKPAPKIADLNLFYAEQITDQGMTAIKDWKHLKRLNVRGTRISDGTLEIVSHLTGLEALDIANTPITDNGLDYLITLTNLKGLTLGRRRLSDNALGVLRLLPTLTYLDLSGPAAADTPDVTPVPGGALPGAMREAEVRTLAELKDLRVLRLGHSNISGNGLKILSALEHVERLGLEACAHIDDNAVVELANWKSLKSVDLQDTKVTEQGLEGLKKAKPGLAILADPAAARKVKASARTEAAR